MSIGGFQFIHEFVCHKSVEWKSKMWAPLVRRFVLRLRVFVCVCVCVHGRLWEEGGESWKKEGKELFFYSTIYLPSKICNPAL